MAHSIKGLGLYYGCHYIKKVFLDYENYLEKYRFTIDSDQVEETVQYLNNSRHDLYNYINKYGDRSIRNAYDMSTNFVYRKVKKYKFKMKSKSLKEFQAIISCIKSIVLVYKAVKTKEYIIIFFVSNLREKQLKVLFSAYKGKLSSHFYSYGSCYFKHNILKNLYCYHEVKMPSGDYLDRKYIAYSLNKGICNIANENDVFVRSEICFCVDYIPKSIVEIALIPVLEILKNAFSHGKNNRTELFIKLSFCYNKGKYVLKIINKGDRIDLKTIVANSIKDKIVTAEQVKQMKKKELMDLVFTKFVSGAKEVNNVHGHGIGLYSAKKTMEEHGGTITAKNRLFGVEFNIEIPGPLGINKSHI